MKKTSYRHGVPLIEELKSRHNSPFWWNFKDVNYLRVDDPDTAGDLRKLGSRISEVADNRIKHKSLRSAMKSFGELLINMAGTHTDDVEYKFSEALIKVFRNSADTERYLRVFRDNR